MPRQPGKGLAFLPSKKPKCENQMKHHSDCLKALLHWSIQNVFLKAAQTQSQSSKQCSKLSGMKVWRLTVSCSSFSTFPCPRMCIGKDGSGHHSWETQFRWSFWQASSNSSSLGTKPYLVWRGNQWIMPSYKFSNITIYFNDWLTETYHLWPPQNNGWKPKAIDIAIITGNDLALFGMCVPYQCPSDDDWNRCFIPRQSF